VGCSTFTEIYRRHGRQTQLPGPLRAYYRPRQLARTSHLVMSSFVPTTLIIYIENGEIKTRIERQLTQRQKNELTPASLASPMIGTKLSMAKN
jgi:hypothetical protein